MTICSNPGVGALTGRLPAPPVNILVLNWNRWQETLECLATIEQLTYSNFRVTVIDNGSDDGSEDALRARRPDLDILQTGSNLGFAGGFNVGIAQALSRGDGLIWIVNNDTRLPPASLDVLVEGLLQEPQIGIVSPVIRYLDAPERVWYGGGRIQPWRGMAENFSQTLPGTEPFKVKFVSGCAMLVRSDVFSRCGLLREDYFLNIEDWEFCWRAYRAGFELAVVPGCPIYHKVGVSKQGERSFDDYYYFIRNRLFFIGDCLPWYFRLSAYLVFFVHLPVWLVKLALRGDWQTFKATWLGVRDFLMGRRNKKRL